MTGYVCVKHLDHEVSWRGTGCTACAEETRKKPPRRQPIDEFDPYSVRSWRGDPR